MSSWSRWGSASLVLFALVPTVWLLLAGAGVVAALAHYGRPAGRTLIGTAVVAPRFRKLNSDIVLRAYYAAGLGKPDKPDQQIQFGSPMARDARNTGSQVVIDLPYGKGWSDVMNAREKIASGLDVHVNQVFLTPDKTSVAAAHAVRDRPGPAGRAGGHGPICWTASRAASGGRCGSARTSAATWSSWR